MEDSREIAKLLVPTDPGGSWQGLRWHTIFARVSVALTVHSHHTHTPITHIRKHCFLIEASMDQFLLYEGSCLLKTGPEGHQMGVKQRSMTSHRGGGLRHERWGLYILHTSWGVGIYQCCLGLKGTMREAFESVFSNLCAQILHV